MMIFNFIFGFWFLNFKIISTFFNPFQNLDFFPFFVILGGFFKEENIINY
jgi:hypothetical protein